MDWEIISNPKLKEEIPMAKIVNYTDEMTATMVAKYTAVKTEPEAVRDAMVLELATELKKSERSIRAKLSRENVYVAKTVVSKVTGETPAKKVELAARLAEVSGANINVDNVAKMNKVDIQRLVEAFEALQPEPSEEIVADEMADTVS